MSAKVIGVGADVGNEALSTQALDKLSADLAAQRTQVSDVKQDVGELKTQMGSIQASLELLVAAQSSKHS